MPRSGWCSTSLPPLTPTTPASAGSIVPLIRFQVDSAVSPEAVLAAMTDFSEHRAEVWPNIDKAHFRVHAQGPGWADVTEGNSLAGGVWERNRYEWGRAPGTLLITTIESNTWKPGSSWNYQVTARPGGSRIDVTVLRHGRGVKGTLLGLLLAAFGSRILSADMRKVLRSLPRSASPR